MTGFNRRPVSLRKAAKRLAVGTVSNADRIAALERRHRITRAIAIAAAAFAALAMAVAIFNLAG